MFKIYLCHTAIKSVLLDPLQMTEVLDGVLVGFIEEFIDLAFLLTPAETITKKTKKVGTTTVDLKSEKFHQRM